MAMVGVDSGSLYRRTHSLSRLHGLVLGRRPLGDVLHSSNKSGKFLQWLCHDDSTINIVLELLLFTIIIIIVKIKKTSLLFLWNARYTGLKRLCRQTTNRLRSKSLCLKSGVDDTKIFRCRLPLNTTTKKKRNKNLAIANRSRVSCAQNTLRASKGLNITP